MVMARARRRFKALAAAAATAVVAWCMSSTALAQAPAEDALKFIL